LDTAPSDSLSALAMMWSVSPADLRRMTSLVLCMEILLTGIVPPKFGEDAKQFVDFQHFLFRYAQREHGLHEGEQGLRKYPGVVHNHL
jgi:hypothetical protein